MLTVDNSMTPYTDCTATVLLPYVQRPVQGGESVTHLLMVMRTRRTMEVGGT